MTEAANGTTIVSVQGMRMGDDGGKRPARVVALGPRGEIEWVHEREDAIWSYDVDPQPDGTIFVTATVEDRDGDGQAETAFYTLDPETGEVVWEEIADFHDTHDADLLDDERILVANMRATDGVDGNRDRLLVYDRTSDAVVWDWQFRESFDDPDVGGNYSDDWTHVNDIDAVNDTHYLASPKNFDMVVMVNRTAGEVAWTIGEPNSGEKLLKQHNPAYYESENGTPTVLVADSENDRVVEYAHRDGEWERTWRVGDESTMGWPRDADRLPNGNTLVGDSANDRVFEVTPDGEVVWEVYTPWLVYEVERVPHGDEPDGPTMADLDATGDVELTGDAAFDADRKEACAAALRNATAFSELGDGDGDASDGDASDGESDASEGADSGDAEIDAAADDGELDPVVVLGILVVTALVGAVLASAVVASRRRGRD